MTSTAGDRHVLILSTGSYKTVVLVAAAGVFIVVVLALELPWSVYLLAPLMLAAVALLPGRRTRVVELDGSRLTLHAGVFPERHSFELDDLRTVAPVIEHGRTVGLEITRGDGERTRVPARVPGPDGLARLDGFLREHLGARWRPGGL